jgi:hypothetical protein
MNAYLFKYKHLDDDSDTTYCCWKIAKDENTAFKFAFGKSKKRNQNTLTTKRGMRIHVLSTEDYDVSKVFPISKIQREESSEGVSDNDDGML